MTPTCLQSAIKLSKEQIAQYRQVFDLFDKDHTGEHFARHVVEPQGH
jgi:calmodulin